LGLHIASELARVNFGALSVDSVPGAGSTFSFTVPVFDIEALIPAHVGFLQTCRHGFDSVSIAIATLGDSDEAAAPEAERFLSRHLRSYDLLLRVRAGIWLICAAADERGLAGILERLRRELAENRKYRPEIPPFDVSFRFVGCWAIAHDAPVLVNTFKAAEMARQELDLH